jgi:hypothetical protein
MSNVQKMAKKIVTIGVAFSTILWSVGVSLMPVAAVAVAGCPDSVVPGSNVKSSAKAAIYAVDANYNKRYYTNGDDFKSWNATNSYAPNYTLVSQACLDAMPLVAQGPFHVFTRPGSGVYSNAENTNLYVVQPNGVVATITPEAAKVLYGANYKVRGEIGLSEWAYYKKTGTAITEAKVHPGMLVSYSGKTWYVDTDSSLREVTATGFTANRFKTDFVRAVPASAVAGMATGATIDAYVAAISDRLMGGTVGPVNPNQNQNGGALTVSLAADNPAGATIADGTAYNKMLKVNLTAASKAVQVKGITVTRTGLISNSLVTGISVWDAQGRRHGDVMTSFNSDNQVTIGFGSDPILVAAGGSESLTVAFNIDASAGSGTVGATLSSMTSVTSDASSVAGTFPITGNVMSIVDGAASLADVAVEGQGVGGTTDGGSANVSIGETKEIGKFKFTQSNGKNDIVVEGVTFYLEGTVKEKDLKDFVVLAPDNTELGRAEYASNRYVSVKFSKALTIPKGTNRVVTLKAMFNDGSGNQVRVKVQNDYDVVVRDAALGYGLVPTGFTAQTGGSSSYFVIKSGSLTVTKDPASLSGNVSAGTADLELGKFRVTAVGEDMEIRKAAVQVSQSGSPYDLTGNVRVVVDGATVLTLSADAAAVDNGTQQNLSQYFTVKSGETKVVTVVGNVSTNATSTQYTAGLGDFYAKRMSTLDFVDDQPSNTLTTANALTVQATNLTFTKDTTQGNATVSPASTVTIAQFVVRAGSAEDVRLTSMVLKNTGTASADLTLQNLEAWSGGAQLGSTISDVSTSSNSFSFDLSVPKNTSKVITVKAYVTSDAVTSATYVMDVDSHNYIGVSTNNTTSVTDDVSAQTMTVGAANLLITAANDSTTISSVRTPSPSTQVQLGKWKFEAQNETVTVDKLTLRLVRPDGSINLASGNFGTLALYDANDMNNALATGEYVPGTSNGYVRFSKTDMVTLNTNQIKYLVLKGTINGSGTINSASTSAWAFTSDASDDIQIRKSSGGTLSTGQIDIGNNGADDTRATSTWYLFHDAAPVITSVSLGSSLDLNTQAPIFKFTVTNPGDREIRISSTSVKVTVSGLAAAGTNGTGTLGAFKLWEANQAGQAGTQLAATSTCIAGGTVATLGGVTCANTNTTNAQFNSDVDTNSLLDNLTVAAGGSRTFVVTADTSNVFSGKTQGSVSVSAVLDGDTGFSSGDSTNEANWSNGVVYYFYTPTGASENSTAYSASDSYDVVGGTLSRSL